jgi:hypothetical protein
MSLNNGDSIDAFARSIGWFDIEPSEYTGQGNYKTRKAPSSKAKDHPSGTIRTGMDGNKWRVSKGKKRWVRVK